MKPPKTSNIEAQLDHLIGAAYALRERRKPDEVPAGDRDRRRYAFLVGLSSDCITLQERTERSELRKSLAIRGFRPGWEDESD